MPRSSAVHAVTTLGIDMGKNTLHMIGLDTRGGIVLREKVSRGRITSRLANLPPCLSVSKRGWRRTTLLASLPRWATT
jgi:transposase